MRCSIHTWRKDHSWMRAILVDAALFYGAELFHRQSLERWNSGDPDLAGGEDDLFTA